jgi:hypothetical protein
MKFANLELLLTFCLMDLIHRPFVFLVVAALAGMGWTLSASEREGEIRNLGQRQSTGGTLMGALEALRNGSRRRARPRLRSYGLN